MPRLSKGSGRGSPVPSVWGLAQKRNEDDSHLVPCRDGGWGKGNKSCPRSCGAPGDGAWGRESYTEREHVQPEDTQQGSVTSTLSSLQRQGRDLLSGAVSGSAPCQLAQPHSIPRPSALGSLGEEEGASWGRGL